MLTYLKSQIHTDNNLTDHFEKQTGKNDFLVDVWKLRLILSPAHLLAVRSISLGLRYQTFSRHKSEFLLWRPAPDAFLYWSGWQHLCSFARSLEDLKGQLVMSLRTSEMLEWQSCTALCIWQAASAVESGVVLHCSFVKFRRWDGPRCFELPAGVATRHSGDHHTKNCNNLNGSKQEWIQVELWPRKIETFSPSRFYWVRSLPTYKQHWSVHAWTVFHQWRLPGLWQKMMAIYLLRLLTMQVDYPALTRNVLYQTPKALNLNVLITECFLQTLNHWI